MPYTPTTWVNGTTAVNAVNMNHIESYLATINSAATDGNISAALGILTVLGIAANTAPITLNGSTSGTVTFYQPLQGTGLKVIYARFTNFRNNGGSAQTITLPAPFTNRSRVWTGDMPSTGIQFNLSGTPQTVAVLTALAVSNGTKSNTTTVNSNCQGEILAGFDTLAIPTGATAVNDGTLIIIGD